MLLFAALFCLVFVAPVQAAVPEGVPYINSSIIHNNTYDEDEVKAAIAAWFVSNDPSTFSSLAAGDVVIYDSAAADNATQFVKIALSPTEYDHVVSYSALDAILLPLLGGSVLPAHYNVTSADIIENSIASVVVSLASVSDAYLNEWVSARISLTSTPRVGMSVVIRIAAENTTSVVFAPSADCTITYPENSTEVQISSSISGTLNLTLQVVGGTDDAGRYSIDSSLPQWNVFPLETLTVTQDTVTDNFDGTNAVPFYISATSYRNPTLLDVIVTLVPSSPLLTIVSPGQNVSLSTLGMAYPIIVTAPTGNYAIDFVLNPSFSVDGVDHGVTNIHFAEPSQINIVFRPSLTVTIGAIPDGFMVNPPYGPSYGGAYSYAVQVDIERPPITQFTLQPASSDVDFSPATLVFAPGTSTLFFTARAFTKGVKTVTFTKGGADAPNYADPPNQNWYVRGKNPSCHLYSDYPSCIAVLGCQWNELLGRCSNSTLPIALTEIPLLYDGEMSTGVTLTLPTPVSSDLAITFSGNLLSFSPASIQLSSGATSAVFYTTGTLPANGAAATVQLQLFLSGSDANVYDQQIATATIRPRIQCAVSNARPFFVTTESDLLNIECDTGAETEVILTPVPASGIAFDPATIRLVNGMRSAQFIVKSTSQVTGVFTLNWVIEGVNAGRYTPVTISTIQVLPSGEVQLPPTFFVTENDMSMPLHADITVMSPTVLNVELQVQTGDGALTNDVQIIPPALQYNGTVRGIFRVRGSVVGWYLLVAVITGVHAKNYVPPAPRSFEIQRAYDGRAYDAWLGIGHMPQKLACRVNVGRSSNDFKGQAAIDMLDAFCDKYPSPTVNSTFDCSEHNTELKCNEEISTKGNVCVWHEGQCVFIPDLQGFLKGFVFGSGFTVLLTGSGEVWTVGSSKYGQLGHYSKTVQKVEMPEPIAAVAAGTSHGMALSSEGRVYTWGANHKGQLGQDTLVKQTEVVGEVHFPKGENITCISSGTLHSGALSLSGKLFMWGSNEVGQLGHEHTYRRTAGSPVPVSRELFNGEAISAFQCGEYHTMVLTDSGAWTFGSNAMGQLGRDGFDDWRPAPPLLWKRNKYRSPPDHKSYVSGREDCP